MTRTPSVTPSDTPDQVPTATKTLAPNGPLVLDKVLIAPQPLTQSQAKLAVELEGPASDLELRIYTVDLALALKFDLPGNYQVGWNTASFSVHGLADGIYFYTVVAKQGGTSSSRKLGKMAILR
jgi:hypothetical protein